VGIRKNDLTAEYAEIAETLSGMKFFSAPSAVPKELEE
jgi:hypothetical protein